MKDINLGSKNKRKMSRNKGSKLSSLVSLEEKSRTPSIEDILVRRAAEIESKLLSGSRNTIIEENQNKRLAFG